MSSSDVEMRFPDLGLYVPSRRASLNLKHVTPLDSLLSYLYTYYYSFYLHLYTYAVLQDTLYRITEADCLESVVNMRATLISVGLCLGGASANIIFTHVPLSCDSELPGYTGCLRGMHCADDGV